MASSRARSSYDSGGLSADPSPRRGVRRGRTAGRRLTCLLTNLHPQRALSNALVQHLAHEMPGMDFTLRADDPDVVWVCGFEPGAEELVRDLRGRHPGAFIVVTGRGPIQAWERGVTEAGADYICGWPIPVADLTRILRPVEQG